MVSRLSNNLYKASQSKPGRKTEASPSMNSILPKLLLSLGLFSGTAFAQSAEVPLWPGPAPGSEDWNYPETVTLQPPDSTRRITNVTRPTLTIFLPEASLANGTAIIICPGGGFRWLSFDNEGTILARWLNAQGVAAFVLKYRVMRTRDSGERDSGEVALRSKAIVPLAVADGQRAVSLVRSRAAEWHLAKDRIGILGFSAGGHVAVAVSMHHDDTSRPDFAAFIYPGTPEELNPPADAPPMFLAQADDDKSVPPADHAIRIYQAWKKAGLSAEMHIFARGGHGFGMRKSGLPAESWTDRFRDWLGAQGLLKSAK
jgi:acetyl esterase/lipase